MELELDKTIQESLQSQNYQQRIIQIIYYLDNSIVCLGLKLSQFINHWTRTLLLLNPPPFLVPTLDDVKFDGGRGGVVRPALVLPAVGGGDGLEEEGDDRHLGLVHHQTDARLVGGDLGSNISQYHQSLSLSQSECCVDLGVVVIPGH